MNGQHMMKQPKTFLLLALALLVTAGLGFGVWRTAQAGLLPITLVQAASTRSTATASAYQTTAVRNGNLAISVSGSGKVISLTTTDLGFGASGNIATLNVQAGDTVTKGQVLAVLDNLDQLKLNIQTQQVAVATAQKTLDDLQNNAAAALAQAQVDLAAAQKAYATAQANLHQQGDARCSATTTENYYQQYVKVQGYVDTWEGYLSGGTGYSQTYILQRLTPMRKQRDQAYANWQYCSGYTGQEILNSQAAYQLAKANLDKANTTYTALKSTSGVDASALQIARAALTNAQAQRANSQKALSGATILAPFGGTVTAVNGVVGQAAGSSTVITLSDLSNPQVQVNIDETDLGDFAVGCAAQVTFTSLSGQTFPGTVTHVEPSLVTVQSVSMVQGLVALEKKQAASGKNLPLGLDGSVEVTCQQASNVLLVPAQALYQSAGQATAYVYVLNAQGQPEKRTVTVGLKTVALAEIRSGLTIGEKVITSTVEAGQ